MVENSVWTEDRERIEQLHQGKCKYCLIVTMEVTSYRGSINSELEFETIWSFYNHSVVDSYDNSGIWCTN